MITAHTACAVCLICCNRTVLILALNLVFTHFGTGYGVSEHTCISLCIFFQKSVVILNINPVRTDTDGNFACFKVLRDNFSRAVTFFSKSLSICFAYSLAIFSFSLTLPERYSEASSYPDSGSSSFIAAGFLKMSLPKSAISFSGSQPTSCDIYAMSTLPVRSRDTCNASCGVSTFVTLTSG